MSVVTRSLTRLPSRRDVLRGLASAGLGLGLARLPEAAAARKKRRKKTKPKQPKPNEFGCLSVGAACQDAGQCCSGICDGKKGKRACRAHGTGTCKQDGQEFCTTPDLPLARCNNDTSCGCFRTTAGSTFCGHGSYLGCADCKKDGDCEGLEIVPASGLRFPPGSACVPFTAGRCAGTCESGKACLPPCDYVPPDPE